MLHGLMSMLYLDVLDLNNILAVIGLNDQMNSKEQEVLKTDRMKELKRCQGIINDEYIEWRKTLCRKLYF